MSNEPALAESDIGRIYIKGYLYPISYPKIVKKDIPYHFFERDMLRDIYPNFRDFKVVYPTLSYYILFRKKYNFGVLLPYKMHFFVKYRNNL
jgi:hypothetical protein